MALIGSEECSPWCPSSRTCPVVRSYRRHCSGLELKYAGTEPDHTGRKVQVHKMHPSHCQCDVGFGSSQQNGVGELRSARPAAAPQTTLVTLLTHLLGQFSALPQEWVRSRPAAGEPPPQSGWFVGCWVRQTGLGLNLCILTWEM